MVKEWSCYILKRHSRGRAVYVGMSSNPERRIRQHNREITGGAKKTAFGDWKRVAQVTGFPDKRAALQFEYMWHKRGPRPCTIHTLDRWVQIGRDLIEAGKSTKASIPFADYPGGPPLLVEWADPE